MLAKAQSLGYPRQGVKQSLRSAVRLRVRPWRLLTHRGEQIGECDQASQRDHSSPAYSNAVSAWPNPVAEKLRLVNGLMGFVIRSALGVTIRTMRPTPSLAGCGGTSLPHLVSNARNSFAVSKVKPNCPLTSLSSIKSFLFANVSESGSSTPSAIGILTLPCNL